MAATIHPMEVAIMRKHTRNALLPALVGLAAILATPLRGHAHQPFFEETNLTPEHPWHVRNPQVSTAIYASLDPAGDVDYFTFDGRAGQSIYLGLVIPQITGQEEFAPALALLGPGLPEAQLPADVVVPEGAGAQEIPRLTGPATTFYEPFSRTSYWERQDERIELPADGRYTVAVWHPEEEVGRYVMVIGDQERLGGDIRFMSKMKRYWRPVGAEPAERPAGLFARLLRLLGIGK